MPHHSPANNISTTIGNHSSSPMNNLSSSTSMLSGGGGGVSGGGQTFTNSTNMTISTITGNNNNNNNHKKPVTLLPMNRIIFFGAILLFIYIIYVMLKFHSTVKSNESITNNQIKSEFINENNPSAIKNIIKEQIKQQQEEKIDDNLVADEKSSTTTSTLKQLDGNVIDTTNIDSVMNTNGIGGTGNNGKNSFSAISNDEEAQIELVCNLNIHRSDSCYNNCNKINEMKKELELYCKPKDSDESLMKCTNLYNSLICQTNNLVIDLSKISKSSCLKYRSQYNCVNSNAKSMYVYQKNAFKMNCNLDFKNTKFSIDFQKDYFNSFNYDTFENLQIVESENLVTILVFRENGIRNEINNIYYFINELYTTYMVIELFDLGVEWDLIHIVFMDEHENSKFDSIWKLIFKQTRQLNQIYPEMNQLVKFQHVLFQPSVYNSPIINYSKNLNHDCQSVDLLNNFAKIILRKLSTVTTLPFKINQKSVLVVCMYQDDRLKQYWANTVTQTSYQLIDYSTFSTLSIPQQIILSSKANLLIGRGDKLIYSLFMKPSNHVIELVDTDAQTSYQESFNNIAQWKGLKYEKTHTMTILSGGQRDFNIFLDLVLSKIKL